MAIEYNQTVISNCINQEKDVRIQLPFTLLNSNINT